MTHRLLTSLKTFALGAAFCAEARRQRNSSPTDVEPRIRTIDVDYSTKDADDWLFSAAVSPVSQETVRLSNEMSRVSGALSGLRGLLRTISAEAPVVDMPVNGVSVGTLHGDADLFDGEAMAASYGERPEEDADLFIEDVRSLPVTQVELANAA